MSLLDILIGKPITTYEERAEQIGVSPTSILERLHGNDRRRSREQWRKSVS